MAGKKHLYESCIRHAFVGRPTAGDMPFRLMHTPPRMCDPSVGDWNERGNGIRAAGWPFTMSAIHLEAAAYFSEETVGGLSCSVLKRGMFLSANLERKKFRS